ncbi:hypothetical protein HanRHA438_Chr14g0672241 [Helianthus annuus]|nr:hypothetical protein HanRHA438_Chr14g0672241 [Helianthus annuus]
MGHPRPKANFKRGMVGRGWGDVEKKTNFKGLVLLANEVPPCHVRSPAQRPG